MAYIGRQPISGQFEKQQLTADGSTTSFALNWSVGSTSALIVSVGGVLQEPETAYNLSGGGTNIVFTAAPASGDRVYVHFLGQSIIQTMTDMNGVELILDVDADTSIRAATDDTIDIKISDADDFQFTANTFSVLTGSNAAFADSANAKFGTGNDMLLYHDGSNSYITNAVGALKIATETSGIAVTIGHSTSEVTIADNLTVTGTLTGTLATAAQGTITSVGTLTSLTSSGVITGTTVEATGDTSASDNAAVGYTAAEGLILTGQGSTNDVTIKNDADAAVISIPTGTTNVTIAGDLTISGDDLTMATNTSGAVLVGDGTNFNPVVISGDATIATNGALTIANNSIEAAMMADNSIDSDDYVDGSIDTAHIANLQITTALIAADAVDGTKLADNAVDSEHYTDGSIDNAHIADDAIDSEHYADGSIDTAHIADSQVTLAKTSGVKGFAIAAAMIFG
jgi:hypothetical protein